MTVVIACSVLPKKIACHVSRCASPSAGSEHEQCKARDRLPDRSRSVQARGQESGVCRDMVLTHPEFLQFVVQVNSHQFGGGLRQTCRSIARSCPVNVLESGWSRPVLVGRKNYVGSKQMGSVMLDVVHVQAEPTPPSNVQRALACASSSAGPASVHQH